MDGSTSEILTAQSATGDISTAVGMFIGDFVLSSFAFRLFMVCRFHYVESFVLLA